jgi:hypothetical protein
MSNYCTTLKAASAAALTAALLTPSQAIADPPDGNYFFELGGANQILVVAGDADLSGLFPFASLCRKFKTKSSGKVSGDCDIDIPGSSGLDGKVKGEIQRDKDATVLTQVLELDGKISGGGRSFDVDYKFEYKATLKDGDDMIKYRIKVKSCVDGRCEKEGSTTKIPAAAFTQFAVVSTDWTLELDVTTNAKNKIKGDATIRTAEGQKIKLDVKGKHTPGGTSLIKLKKGGTNLRLEDTDVTGDVMSTTMNFKKVFGNSNSFLAVSTAPPEN